MKKAHPSLVIYDEKKGFKKALEIKYEGEEYIIVKQNDILAIVL